MPPIAAPAPLAAVGEGLVLIDQSAQLLPERDAIIVREVGCSFRQALARGDAPHQVEVGPVFQEGAPPHRILACLGEEPLADRHIGLRDALPRDRFRFVLGIVAPIRHRRRVRHAVIGRRQIHKEIPADPVEVLHDRVQHLKSLLGRRISLRDPGKKNTLQRGAGAIAELAPRIGVRQPRQYQGARAQMLGTPTEEFERPKQIGEIFARMKEALVAAEQWRHRA
jgi:hypothetical protein